MQLRAIEGRETLRSLDTGSVVFLEVTDFDGSLMDLESFESIEVVLADTTGRLRTFTPELEDEDGRLSFLFDDESVLPNGEYKVEIHMTLANGRLRIAPSRGRFNMRIERSIDEMGQEVNVITLQSFQAAIAAAIERADEATARAEAVAALADDLEAVADTLTGAAEAEQARALAETARQSAESARVSAEQARVLAEEAREGAEGLREDAEFTRESNEGARQAAEQAREGTVGELVDEANSLISNAQALIDETETAIARTNEAAQRAEDAADSSVSRNGDTMNGELNMQTNGIRMGNFRIVYNPHMNSLDFEVID